jgi:Yip1 domain
MNLIDRVKNILITPKTEWPVVNAETQTLSTVITAYVVPLALIGGAATFIGYGFIGIDYGFIRMKGIQWGIKMAAMQLVASIVGVVITTYIIDALAPSFSSTKNINKSAQLIAYGYTPAFIGAILSVFPVIAWLGSLFGLYGIYLMYLGLGPLKNTPDDKKVIYLIVTVIALVVVYGILITVFGSILGTRLSIASLDV